MITKNQKRITKNGTNLIHIIIKQNSEYDLMEGGRDARSVSEGRDAAGRPAPPRRDFAPDCRKRP